jgi:acetylornithine deacetylase/succinyl-diaminopimelate desuccinylase-like protein
MKEMIQKKLKGMRRDLDSFVGRMSSLPDREEGYAEMADLVAGEMQRLEYDKVMKDKAGNIIGIINGYTAGEDLVLLSHFDFLKSRGREAGAYSEPLNNFSNTRGEAAPDFKSGVITALYTGALIKRALVPLKGNLIVCCVPRNDFCDYGIEYLFSSFFKKRSQKIKGVMLCEPTDFNIYLGNKGHIEYEIVVKGKMQNGIMEQRGVNILGTMFPLISELEKVSQTLPRDFEMGASSLKIKDVRYSGFSPSEEYKEFCVVADRIFVPEEDKQTIMKRATHIAKSIYRDEPEVQVSTALAKSHITTLTGLELVLEKEVKPWKIESHHPLALSSMQVLKEAGFSPSMGYWKKIITEGSYTFGELKIPTIGFGAGSEERPEEGGMASVNEVEKAVFGSVLITHRNIGIPTFGWTEDEI